MPFLPLWKVILMSELSVADREAGWIEWKGGNCPLAAETNVQIMCRDGDTSVRQPAGWCDWQHGGEGEHDAYDIIAYRVVQS
jgi:hypothetical protein